MIGTFDSYYSRPEASNSDLSWLDKYFSAPERAYDIQSAYRFGNLVDAMITEKERCNHLSRKVDNEQFSKEEWDKATSMFNAFRKDEFCRKLLENGEGQKVFTGDMNVDYYGFKFSLLMRCKFDLWLPKFGWGVDIKSTAATTQRQFEDAIRYFDYDRQRYVYMGLSGSKQDMLIGISKVNFKIFKVPITRDSELFSSGKAKFEELSFRYWYLFGDIQSHENYISDAA